MKKALLVALFFLRATVAHAGAITIFVAPTATGAGTGANCANALAYTFFSVSGNWGAGGSQIGPGSTVNVCVGTYSVALNASAFIFRGSGTSGNVIKLVFDPAGNVTSPAFSGPTNSNNPCTGAIAICGQNFLLIDGGGSTAANGVTIQNTANGLSLANQQATGCIVNSNGDASTHDVEVKFAQCLNMYVRTACTNAGAPPQCDQTAAAQSVGITLTGTNNLLVHDSTSTQSAGCFGYQNRNSGTNWQIYNNVGVGCRWHANAFATATGAFTVDGMYIHDNDFSDNSPWWDTNDNFHNDVIFTSSGNGGSYKNAYIYNNYLHGALGNQTGIIYVSGSTSGVSGPIWIFNNIFRPTSHASTSIPCTADGWIAAQNVTAEPLHIVNNTFDASVACGLVDGAANFITVNNYTTFDFENNIAWQTQGVWLETFSGGTFTINTDDYWNLGGTTSNFEVNVSNYVYSTQISNPSHSITSLSESGTTVTEGLSGSFKPFSPNPSCPCIVNSGTPGGAYDGAVNVVTAAPGSFTWVAGASGKSPCASGCGTATGNGAYWTGLGFDASSVYADPKLTTTAPVDMLQAGSAATGLAANLNSTCTGQPNPGLGALCFDKAGNARPTGVTPWDAGVYNAQASGVVSLTPGSFSYASVLPPGPSSDGFVTFTLTNNSGGTITLGASPWSLTNATDFTLGTNSCGTTLTNTSSCTILVEFTPATAGAKICTLNATYTGASGSPLAVSLTGTGTALNTIQGFPLPIGPF